MTKARLCQAVARTKLGQAGPGWARLGRDMERHGKTWKGMERHGKTWKDMERHGKTWTRLDQAGPGWARLGKDLGGTFPHSKAQK